MEAKELRERHAAERRTGRIVREAERDIWKNRLETLESTLKRLNTDILSACRARELEEIQETLRQGLQREHRERAEKKRREEEEDLKGRQREPNGGANPPRSQRPRAAGQATTEACVHQGWWTQVEGRHRCGRCLKTTTLFAFRCPGCFKVACRRCRNALKGGAFY